VRPSTVTRPGPPTIGVEEEFFVVDPVSRTPLPAGPLVVEWASAELGDMISGEFTRYQIEVKTPPCVESDRLRAELVRLRTAASVAAATEGLRICGDADVVDEFLRRLEVRGTGTDLQRTSAARHGELAGVVDDLIALTVQT
jgi:Glutamate-cysteine ligase family 2(GCS2)